MKKQFTFLLFLFFVMILGTPISTYALTSYYDLSPPGSSPSNPLYFEEVETPSQRQQKATEELQRKLKESSDQMAEYRRKTEHLSNLYDGDSYRACHNSYCANKDLANPSTNKQCLSLLEYCLSSKKQYKNADNINLDKGCKDKYGQYSYFKEINSSTGGYICDCLFGYKWQGDICIKKELEKQEFACIDDYVKNGDVCISKNEGCKNNYGLNSYYTGKEYICDCQNGYKWNDKQTSCIEDIIVKGISDSNNTDKKLTTQEEKTLIIKIDNSLSKRMNGKILLQVEKNGEGWYVYPDNKKKYYLGRPADAFGIMRNLGLGIKHSELKNYLKTKFPGRLSGKIVLDVEQNGEAYYINPDDLKGYYLGRPADAFKIMRELGLGITNSDIRKIDVGEVE